MVGIQRKRVVDWFSNNIDLFIILSGIVVVLVAKLLEDYKIGLDNISANVGFWLLFLGIVMLSIGIASLICYRIILKWNKFLS